MTLLIFLHYLFVLILKESSGYFASQKKILMMMRRRQEVMRAAQQRKVTGRRGGILSLPVWPGHCPTLLSPLEGGRRGRREGVPNWQLLATDSRDFNPFLLVDIRIISNSGFGAPYFVYILAEGCERGETQSG